MLQSNRADIGMFESLQSNQHAKTGVSQMAVFNDLNAVKAELLKQNKLYEKMAVLKKASEGEYTQVEKQINARREEEMSQLRRSTHPDVPKTKEWHKSTDESEQYLKTVVVDVLKKEVDRINSIEKPTERVKEATALRQTIKTTVNPEFTLWYKSRFDPVLSQIKK
jgi:hypothetical protein